MPNWTDEQKQAIYEKGNNILVAAAAGSGKTAVLVERMINKIINEKIDINKILVVTFTNAAASEMRERILDAIYKKLEENPDDENMQKQITLLNMASICTIDSFCLDVVKSNFYEVENVSPNFRIADTPEIELLKEEVLEDLFEEKYENEDKDFETLINTYTTYRDDTPLKELIKKIYQYISSNPFPLKWLHQKIQMFNLDSQGLLNKDFSQTIWGKELLKDLHEELKDDLITLRDVSTMLNNSEELEVFYQIIQSDIKQLTYLENNLDSWDNAYQISQNIKFLDWSRKKVESEIKNEAKAIRDIVKEKFNKKKNSILVTDSKQACMELFEMYPILEKLENLIIEFDTRFSNRKREKNIVDFSDIEHLALKILVKEDENGNIIKTDIAKKYAEKFEEIAIDEYQDSNEVQEYILNAISRDNNIFMVGDVKQSIYKFRQAMPELFLKKYKTYKKLSEEGDITTTGKKIQLFMNFRSRSNVLDFTNHIFKNIMSEQLGDVDYTEEEFLNFGAVDYKENNQNLNTEIDIIDTSSDTDEKQIENINYDIDIDEDETESQEELEHLEDIEIEAKYIANKIKKLIDSKYQIYDRKQKIFRNITPRDIVILLRSTKEKASIYEQELIKMNLPVFCDSTQEYLDTIEIETIMNLLKIIDNPIQDIPLVTVMRSPIADFTDDDLVEIRLSDKQSSFYECMQKAKINVQPKLRNKIERFLDYIEQCRKEQEYLALDELIWKIYIDTGYYNYVGMMPNGEQRQANLKVLFERAKQYETASFKGLYNFINFIEKLKLSSGDLSSAKIIGENDDVIRIMSIHKSKGLEFPIVFLANANKQFNKQDIRKDDVLLEQKYGIGVRYINYDKQVQYDTLARQAVKSQIEVENISEEMRILYVALTRAKEKIYITATKKNVEDEIEKLQKQIRVYKKENDKINPIILKKCKSYLEWILLVYLYNEEHTKKIANVNIIQKENIEDILKNGNETQEEQVVDLEDETGIKGYTSQKSLAENVKSTLEYKYKYIYLTQIPTKMSVTEIKQLRQDNVYESENLKKEEEYENINFAKPIFLQEDMEKNLTGAEKGTVMHLCMQNLNFKKQYNINDIRDFVEELYEKHIITEKEKESVSIQKIYSYTQSNIWSELKEAKLIEKEKPFYIQIPAKDIYMKDIDGEILVQGIIDLYYINKNDELILLDYKTDYAKTKEELINKYKVQLDIYKKALEESLQRKVNKVYIYSLHKFGEIEVS